MMNEWMLADCAPLDTAVIVFTIEGDKIAVGRKDRYGAWFIDESFGFNEDGQIYGVTHWMPLPEPPNASDQ